MTYGFTLNPALLTENASIKANSWTPAMTTAHVTTAQLKAMTEVELELSNKRNPWWSAATTNQLEAMTTSEVVEEVWMSAGAIGDYPPWRRSGTRAFRVLLVNDATRELVARMTGRKSGRSWRGKALRPRE